MKIVLDTNVIIAAFATHGLCEALFEVCLEGHQVFSSQELIDELDEKLGSVLRLPKKDAQEIIALVKRQFSLVKPSRVPKDASGDSDDLIVLGTAVAAVADTIVTGDKDLLVLKKYGAIQILSPRETWTWFQQNG